MESTDICKEQKYPNALLRIMQYVWWEEKNFKQIQNERNIRSGMKFSTKKTNVIVIIDQETEINKII